MRTATVVVLSLLAALAAAVVVPHSEAGKELLEKQDKTLLLLYHIQQPTLVKEEQEIAKTYKPIEHVDNYQYKEKVEIFWKYYVDVGFLPKGEVFSVYYQKHFYQARALFELFYFAKDFETFYKTAVWAREHLNKALFVYSFTVAVLHRDDTKYVTLPAPYEICPQLFVNAEVIQKAYDARLRGYHSKPPSTLTTSVRRRRLRLPSVTVLVTASGTSSGTATATATGTAAVSVTTSARASTTSTATASVTASGTATAIATVVGAGYSSVDLVHGQVGSKEAPYVFYSNYSGYPEANNPEELVSYFTEDVGLNSFNAYLTYKYPFWFNSKNYSLPEIKYRGESFFFVLQQLLARYYLERLSNHLPDVKPIDYNDPVLVGYYPELRLQNGREAPARPEGIFARNIDILYVEQIKNYERRIRDGIDYGYFAGYNYEKYNVREKDYTDVLGNILEGNEESINKQFYGAFYRNLISLFGHIVDPVHRYGVPASVLEQPETQLRDPLFYRIAKRVLSIFYHYKNLLKPYTYGDLYLPGVTVEDITFDKLVTYFDTFDFVINNALTLTKPEDGAEFSYVARQYRLNNKPFFYHLKVKSEKEVDSVVRVFIGPKYDYLGREYSLEERKQYYVLLDLFNYKLTAGENDIKRSSNDFRMYTKESPSYYDLYQATRRALKGEDKFFLDKFRSHWGFPRRLALPRGTPSGLPLSVFAIVTPAVSEEKSPVLERGDNHHAGFPFDRRVVEFEFNVPNAHFDETFVVHRRAEDSSATA